MEYVLPGPALKVSPPCGDKIPNKCRISIRNDYNGSMVSVGPMRRFAGPVCSAKKNAWWLINTRHVLVNADRRLKGVYKGAALAGHHYFVDGTQERCVSNLSARASEFLCRGPTAAPPT